MHNLIETALFKANAAHDRAVAHNAFADMFDAAGMSRLATARRALAESEWQMVRVWRGMADALA